ncbi:MAG TPA: toll/interleukin-1 receptor domain-containing protein [Baekduia sp.]|nr:toll/interleukin-1 receptor domain-containing protein [Baekduia sp.]
MALSRRDRIRLKTQLIEALANPEWTWDRTNVLLSEFGFGSLSDDRFAPSIAEMITDATDEVVVEMYSVVMDVDADEVQEAVAIGADDGNWKRGYARVFLSHSALHKQFVGEVASELAVVGIHGFVAHDAMEYSKPWQIQIEQALRTMQAFVALVHPEVNQSAWCQQEIGWALGRRVPLYVLRLGADPAGFIGRDQWPSAASQTPKQVAATIAGWVTRLPDLGPSVFEGLLEALRSAQNYMDAGATAERIEALGSLEEDQLAAIDHVWWTNDQLYGGVFPSRAMQRVYASHSRAWPPPKPDPSRTQPEEEPF